jgi:SNF2 family DNA or RNA helicase
MGTGKTLFGLERDAQFRETIKTKSSTFRTLVIAPSQTHSGWIRAIKENLPDTKYCRLDGRNPKTRAQFLNPQLPYDSGLTQTSSGIWLMHWDAVRLMAKSLREFGFHHVILDECHRIKNAKAARTTATKSLKIPLATDMSGSPIANRPQDLWSILNHLYPNDKYYSSYWRFVFKYLEVDQSSGYNVIGGPKQIWLDEGFPEIQPFYSRVEARDCIDLPPVNEIRIECSMDSTQSTAYKAMEQDWLAWVDGLDESEAIVLAPSILVQLRRLQQFAISSLKHVGEKEVWAKRVDPLTGEKTKIRVMKQLYRPTTPSSKLDAVVDIIEDNSSESFVVFSQFSKWFYLLQEALLKKKIDCVLYTGDQDLQEREYNLNRFTSGNCRVICLTYGAGGEGLDGLQYAARNCILIDRHASPTVNDQAIARLVRAGANISLPVNIIDIVTTNTIDDSNLLALLEKKININRMMGILHDNYSD